MSKTGAMAPNLFVPLSYNQTTLSQGIFQAFNTTLWNISIHHNVGCFETDYLAADWWICPDQQYLFRQNL